MTSAVISCIIWQSLYDYLALSFLPNFAPIAVCGFVYVRLCRKGTWFLHLLVPVLFTAGTGAVTLGVLGALSSLWGIDTQSFMSNLNVRIPATGIILLFYLLFVFLLVHFAKKQRHINTPTITAFIGMMVMPVLIICVLVLLIDNQYGRTSVLTHSLPLIVGIGLMLLNFITIWLFDRIGKQSAEAQRLRAEAYLAHMQVRYQEEMTASYKQMRSWRHDSHNQVQTMLALLEMGKLSELADYMRIYADEFSSIEQFIASGNPMLDALLSAKKTLAHQKKIPMEIHIRLPMALPLTDTKLSILLGNLIDNALEACERMEAAQTRYIHLAISSKDAHLCISVLNTTDGQEHIVRGAFFSMKDSSHGLGLNTIDHIVSDHGGYCERTHEERIFSTTILLPLRATCSNDHVRATTA